jgi:NADH:ubiquinone oxidoreductase subunit 6 (subunit J)
VGVIALVVMVPTLYAIYGAKFAGSWRVIYVVGAVVSVYLNAFVGVVQAFQKLVFLHPLAPNGNEPPFAIAQGLTLLAFVAVGVLGVRRFHPLRTPPL